MDGLKTKEEHMHQTRENYPSMNAFEVHSYRRNGIN